MGFFSKILDGINSFAQDMSNSFSTDATCSKCIKCKQCIKTLSDGKQVRIFTCPAIDENVYNNEYIDSILPSTINITGEYLEAYQKNRDAIYNYLYSSSILYLDTPKPIVREDYTPIFTFNELKYCYKAMECPMFRGFINSDNCLVDNDTLISSTVPDLLTFDSLSEEDKKIIIQD